MKLKQLLDIQVPFESLSKIVFVNAKTNYWITRTAIELEKAVKTFQGTRLKLLMSIQDEFYQKNEDGTLKTIEITNDKGEKVNKLIPKEGVNEIEPETKFAKKVDELLSIESDFTLNKFSIAGESEENIAILNDFNSILNELSTETTTQEEVKVEAVEEKTEPTEEVKPEETIA